MKYYWSKERREFVPADEFVRPPSAAPAVLTDTMPAIRSEADGRMYDSKSSYRRGLRAAGCVEVGNEPIHEAAPREIPDVPDLRADLKQVWREANG